MKRYAKYLTPALGLALLCAAPFVSDAGNNVACCNLASSMMNSIFAGGNGDEEFFTVPGGASNVMILLDDSGSMVDFPKALPNDWPNPAIPAGIVKCSGTYLDAYTALRTNIPYDNGFTTGEVKDDPPWGLGKCVGNACLFNGTAYYRSWDYGPSSATQRTSADACSGAPDVVACQTCLDSAGYALWGWGGAAFRGDFLNAFPPKFVIARKVVKDLAKYDSKTPSPVDNIRLGLTVFKPGCGMPAAGSLQPADGGWLVVPLGPNCKSSYPMDYKELAKARQAVIDAVNNPAIVTFNTCTPLATTLLNIGQYLGSIGQYDTLFGAGWTFTTASSPDSRNNFNETSKGMIEAKSTWVDGDQRSICWSCQQNSVVIVTDGMPNSDANVPKPGVPAHSGMGTAPNLDLRNWTNAYINCPACGAGQNLHKVAAFLHRADLRADYPGTQNTSVYTISFGIDASIDPTALAILDKTAELGGGIFANTSSGTELEIALFNAVTDVASRATSFSQANTSTLQTGNRTQLFLTRFRPHSGPDWEGHVYRFRLFWEFANGCDATKPTAAQTLVKCGAKNLNPNLNGDTDAKGNALCDGLYKLDMDCDPVMEDADGNFVKAVFNAAHDMVTTGIPAKPFWDAGEVLSDKTKTGWRSANENHAKGRKIFTVLDSDSDGRFTSADGFTDFTVSNVSKLAPMMQLDPTWCVNFLGKIGVCGPLPLPACPTVAAGGGWDSSPAANTELCAKHIIYFIRGYDVLDEDEDGCAGPDNPSNTTCPVGANGGEERDRVNDDRPVQEFWKLGDIFHSSPTIVQPPIDEFTCDLGLDPQCVATIHSPQALTASPQTPADCAGNIAACDLNSNGAIDVGEGAYQTYRVANLERQELVLVGGNDGMLHAFDAGVPDKGQAKDPYFGWTYTVGTGEELWAFIPPDLLPKLKNAVDAHDYFVDGDIMVRDVWVDHDKDGRKSPDEFHTMAVVSERSGGSVFTALDVTDPLKPQLRWIFPDLCTEDVNLVGQSWSSFAPRPPPVGPVRLAVPKGGPQDPLGRAFEERWVVAVNGGYDPALVRGKGVWLMDVWTGQVVWRFNNNDFIDQVNAKGGMWPVPGSAALVDLGAEGNMTADFDGFFDTLTWADIGGQIWVARLDPPGVLDASTKRVNNWFAARAFEEQRLANDTQEVTGRSEFYFMPSNAMNPATRFLHTYVGSGNREHILQQGAGCGPDNLLGCCQAGCNVVDVTTNFNYAGGTACDMQEHFKCNGGKLVQDKTKLGGSCTNFDCEGLNGQIQLHLAGCGKAGNPPDVIAHIKCDKDGNCCNTIGDKTCVKVKKGKDLDPTKLPVQPTLHNRFYGVWSYGGPRTFADQAGAVTMDKNRFTDIPYAASCTGTTGNSCTLVNTTTASVNAFGGISCGTSPCTATAYDAGWFYEYGQTCPFASCSPAPPWMWEKTGSAATVIAGCVDWNTFLPQGFIKPGSTTPCTGASGSPQNFNYISNYLTGAPDVRCAYPDSPATGLYRASSRLAIAPPLAPTQLLGLAGGKVQQGAGQPGDPGVPPPGGEKAKALGGTHSLSQPVYWLEVPRDLHQCRHADPTMCR
jgi:type IV pilus assembly protein PilY1